MPPYPGIPYGSAPAWCFPVAEFSLFFLFLFCLAYAVKQGKRDVTYLLGGLAFGLILEYIEVIAGMGYTYGQFTVMLGKAPLNIPVCIGCGWGIIMYTARLFSDSLKLGLWACVAFDTLLAINIDLSMDTVAYRLHMWHWNWAGTNLNPLTADWFGIPYGNFFGWQMVVFFYSAFSRLFERWLVKDTKTSVVKFILVTILALLCAEILLFGFEAYFEKFLLQYLGITSMHRFVGVIIICIAIVIWGWRNRNVAPDKIPAIAWFVPAWFHAFFFAVFFIVGFYLENRWMTIAACVNLLIGVIIHVAPVRFGRK